MNKIRRGRRCRRSSSQMISLIGWRAVAAEEGMALSIVADTTKIGFFLPVSSCVWAFAGRRNPAFSRCGRNPPVSRNIGWPESSFAGLGLPLPGTFLCAAEIGISFTHAAQSRLRRSLQQPTQHTIMQLIRGVVAAAGIFSAPHTTVRTLSKLRVLLMP